MIKIPKKKLSTKKNSFCHEDSEKSYKTSILPFQNQQKKKTFCQLFFFYYLKGLCISPLQQLNGHKIIIEIIFNV